MSSKNEWAMAMNSYFLKEGRKCRCCNNGLPKNRCVKSKKNLLSRMTRSKLKRDTFNNIQFELMQ